MRLPSPLPAGAILFREGVSARESGGWPPRGTYFVVEKRRLPPAYGRWRVYLASHQDRDCGHGASWEGG